MIGKLAPVLIALSMTLFERRLKYFLAGIGLMITSGFFVIIALVLFLMSMFFALADLDRFIAPSLITGGVIILIAVLVAIQSKRIFAKKK